MYIPSQQQLADIFSKPLGVGAFLPMVFKLNLGCFHVQLEGKVLNYCPKSTRTACMQRGNIASNHACHLEGHGHEMIIHAWMRPCTHGTTIK